MKFKIEVEDDKGIWSDVYDAAGKLLTFDKEEDARMAEQSLHRAAKLLEHARHSHPRGRGRLAKEEVTPVA